MTTRALVLTMMLQRLEQGSPRLSEQAGEIIS